MKNKILLIVFLPMFLHAQEYINIGSTKEDVRAVQGEPSSVTRSGSHKEIWGYGEYSFTTITFENGKIVEFNNYESALKIGNIKKSKKQHSKKEVFNRIATEEDMGRNESNTIIGAFKTLTQQKLLINNDTI